MAAHNRSALSSWRRSAPSPVLLALCYASITQRVDYGSAHARAGAKSAPLASHNRIHSSLSVASGAATSQTRTAVQGMGGLPLRPSPGRQGALNVTAVALTHKCAVRAGCVGLWRTSHVNSPKGTALRAAAHKRPARFPVSGWLNARSFAARITKPWPSS